MKDQTAASASSWYQGRKTAGQTAAQMQKILAQARQQCSTTIDAQIMTIATQMATDSVNAMITHTPSGGQR